jgi:hypothetical protein
MYEDVCSGGCVFRRTGVPETGRDATQVQLHPVMLRTRRTTTVMIRVPMTAGATDRLEFEDPRIVFIIEIFVGDQFNITARLRADQRRSGPLPDEGPVVRIAHPQGRRSGLMSKPGMPLTLRMSARLHALFVPHFTSVEEGSLCPRSASSRSAASIHRGLLRSSTVVVGCRVCSTRGASVTTAEDGWLTLSTSSTTHGGEESTYGSCRPSAYGSRELRANL